MKKNTFNNKSSVNWAGRFLLLDLVGFALICAFSLVVLSANAEPVQVQLVKSDSLEIFVAPISGRKRIKPPQTGLQAIERALNEQKRIEQATHVSFGSGLQQLSGARASWTQAARGPNSVLEQNL